MLLTKSLLSNLAIIITLSFTHATSHHGIATRSPPSATGIQFVCSSFPSVCQNMCWGAFCVPSHAESLTYDNPSASVRRERSRAAGCLKTHGNATCTGGYRCNQYPFVTTEANSEEGNGEENRCSRCVPRDQDSRHGAVVAAGYRDFCNNTAPCTFKVFFANQGLVPHCNPGGAGNCDADGGERCSGPISIGQNRTAKNGYRFRDDAINGTFIPGPAEFRTYSGVLLMAPHGGTIGQAVYKPVAVDERLFGEQVDGHEFVGEGGFEQFGYMIVNMRSEVDYIKEVVWRGNFE